MFYVKKDKIYKLLDYGFKLSTKFSYSIFNKWWYSRMERWKMIDYYPKKCPICGGYVMLTTTKKLNGNWYGSGYCYVCTKCHASVSTHKNNFKRALGRLADKPTREMRKKCHEVFDNIWKSKGGNKNLRRELYKRLADRLNIDVEDCHFSWFSLDELYKAYEVCKELKIEYKYK